MVELTNIPRFLRRILRGRRTTIRKLAGVPEDVLLVEDLATAQMQSNEFVPSATEMGFVPPVTAIFIDQQGPSSYFTIECYGLDT